MASYCFGEFELLARERRLLASGQPCPIGTRALDVLVALVERRDRVVTKGELLELAWPGLIVEENNLTVQISALRKLLGAVSIVTVAGRGYQFACECRVEAGLRLPVAEAQGGRLERRLVVFVCADLAPVLSGELASGAARLAAWRLLRDNFIENSLAAFAGEAVEITLDRTVLQFTSAVDALAWSLDVQERLAHACNRDPRLALPLRLAVVASEVVLDEGRLIGDPFAASEALRRTMSGGEVGVTDAVREIVAPRVAVPFVDAGTVPGELQGRQERVWRLEPRRESGPVAPMDTRVLWNLRPTLAVLPFEAGGDPGFKYFGDGITEEIITALSLNRAFLVVSHGSSARFGQGGRQTAHAASELGVRYLVSGSVRRHANRLRIFVSLTDAQANGVIWSEHFDGDDADLFQFQSQIASQVSAAIDPRIHEAEVERVRLKPTSNFDAYDCVLRGLGLQFDDGDDSFEAAGSFFRRAVELDPGYARAHGQLARWHSLRAGDGRTAATEQDRMAAQRHAQRALELDPRDAWNMAVAGHIQSVHFKRFATAMELFDQALSINPNCVLAWARSGTSLAYVGRGEEALDRVRNAMRLSPLDQHAFYFSTTNGTASIVLGRFDEAVAWLSRARRLNPKYRAAMRLLVAAHSLAGEVEAARALAADFMAVEQGFRVSAFAQWYPLQQPHLQRVVDALRAAGLPE